MAQQRWEYRTLALDVEGWINPGVDLGRADAELVALGNEGWELVSVLDLNRLHGRSSSLVAFFKRAR
jgi:hypothetical protein